jgi:Dolichyl-phosphate-mannose-protein mannosyltransferase
VGNKEKYSGFFFLLICLVGISWFYQYPSIWQMPPQGSHLWRQTDCMAMVWNYKLYDLPFFQPATFNLQSLHGNVAGEFPVFYYIAAQFERPEFVLRLLHTIIFISGILSVYFIAFYFLKNTWLAVVSTLLLFTSPLLVFYGNNFLSDVPAWSFAMLGWAIFLPANRSGKTSLFLLAFLFFAFAALLKASHAFNFAIAFFFQFSGYRSNFVLRTSYIKNLIPYSLLLLPASWYLYAKQYNATNHDTYYFLSIFPVWKMSLYDIGLTGWRLLISWSGNYFWRPLAVLLIAAIGFIASKNKWHDPELKKIVAISFLLTLLYLVLFFERMKLHEYYYVFFFVFGVFAVIAVCSLLLPYTEKIYFRSFAVLFLALNSICCKNFIHQKMTCQPYNNILASEGFQKFLNENGCLKDKAIISWPDPSVNQSLYWMKRKGYTVYNRYYVIFKPGPAEFLVISKPDQLENAYRSFIADSLGTFHGVRLYKLK